MSQLTSFHILCNRHLPTARVIEAAQKPLIGNPRSPELPFTIPLPMSYSAPPPLPFHYDRLRGKVIFITGASSGIGEASAKLFAKEGATVVVSARRKDRLDTLVKELEAAGHKAAAVECDVSNEESVKNAIKFAVDRYGKLDGALNNSGIIIPPTPLHETSSEDFDRLHATNTRGVFLCMKYEIAAMLSTAGGSIVNISGITGVIGVPGAAAHASSKFALTGLTRSAALEYAQKGIRVNAIPPGPVRSEGLVNYVGDHMAELAKRTPMNHISDAEDVGRMALFLMTEESRWTTGAVLTSDGGMAAGSGA